MPGWLRRMTGTIRGGPVTVTTPSTRSIVYSLPANNLQSITLFIKNVGSSDARIMVASQVGDIEYTEVPENPITPEDVFKVVLFGVYEKINIYAVSIDPGSPTQLKIAWVGVRA